jgi:hypothetical protein
MSEKETILRIKFLWKEAGVITGQNTDQNYFNSLKNYYEEIDPDAADTCKEIMDFLEIKKIKSNFVDTGISIAKEIASESIKQDGNWFEEKDPNKRTLNLSCNFSLEKLKEFKQLLNLEGMITLKDIKQSLNNPDLLKVQSSSKYKNAKVLADTLISSYFS